MGKGSRELGKGSRQRSSQPSQSRAQAPGAIGATAVAVQPAKKTWHDFGFERCTSLHSYVVLTLATILCLAPFSGRAFHVDDTLFVRAARQITQHPFDPYGFEINWDTVITPMSQVTQNPPLTCYYLALIGRVLGWSERALHLGFLLIAVALTLGTYNLAQKFTRLPLLAALCTLFTPGILVSATSVMCDTMMLALWIWAAYFWIEGLDSDRVSFLVISSVLTAASALTKYFGAALVLLLLVYSIVRLKRVTTRMLWLLLPVAVLLVYEFWTASLYGHGMLGGAADFASAQRSGRPGSVLGMAIVALSYAGGCSLLALSFAPLIFSRKQAAAVLFLSTIAGIAIARAWLSIDWMSTPIFDVAQSAAEANHFLPWLSSCELVLFVAAGIFLLGLAIRDWWEARTASSLFLALWILGTFFFAGFVNWTVNARSVLPLIPAAGILVARRLDTQPSLARRMFALQVAAILFVSAVLSSWVTAADTELANSGRNAATLIYDRTHVQGASLWFVGHWGFQYYMEALGASPLNAADLQARPGDFVVLPENNTDAARILPEFIASQENLDLPLRTRATTISPELGAGFYSSYWGPLPYVIGKVSKEGYSVIRLGNLPAQNRNE